MASEANSTTPRFNYDPLPGPSHIRVLERLKPADDGTLRFSLTFNDLDADGDQQKAYHCLSYTWGNPFAHGNPFRGHFDAVNPQYGAENGTRILVNEQPMMIPKNLHDALSMVPHSSYVDYVNNPPLDGTRGQTFLHIAAARGRPSNIETWIKGGADIDKLDDEGKNAMHYAAGNGHPSCVRTLLQHGCLSDIKDVNGITPAELAKAKGYDEVVSLLEAASPPAQPESGSGDEIMRSTVSRRSPQTFIWADAICINQNDLDEKSAQVTMMDRIYSAAMYVVAWLGPPDEHTDLGIRTLNTLQRHLRQFKESSIEPFGGMGKDKYAEAGVPHISSNDWIALASLFQRQWFRRAWIVQEAVLPSSLVIYVGKKVIPWRFLAEVSEAIKHLEAKLGTITSGSFSPADDVGNSVVGNMAQMAEWRRFKTHTTDQVETEKAKKHQELFALRYLVSEFCTFLASDPRDKVYAYYGLLNLFAAERRRTNYRLSPAEVYTVAAREIIASEGSLRMLSLCVHPQLRRGGLPSWVPDFGLSGHNPIPAIFSADKGLEYVPPKIVDPGCTVLHIRGAFMGDISQAGGRKGTKPGEKVIFDPSWFTMVLSLRDKKGYGEDCNLSEVLWTTLCMDMSPGSLVNSRLYGDNAPAELGIQFRHSILLMILAAADAKVREKIGLKVTTEAELVFTHDDYDPMIEDMEPILADLDAFHEHDGERCWLPSREEVLGYWNNYTFNMVRNTEMDEDGGPFDYYLPKGFTKQNSRAIGNGYLLLGSRIAKNCVSYITAYMLVYGGRHLITVNERYLGMAALSSKPGDEVWLLPGLNAPAVLRPVVEESESGESAETSTKRYQFIGSCYISGMMDGKVAEMVKDRMEDIELA